MSYIHQPYTPTHIHYPFLEPRAKCAKSFVGRLNPFDENAHTLIFLEAARVGCVRAIRELLYHPCVEPTYWQGLALVVASMNGHDQIVRILLNSGKFDVSTNGYEAIRKGQPSCIYLLKKHLKIGRDSLPIEFLFSLTMRYKDPKDITTLIDYFRD